MDNSQPSTVDWRQSQSPDEILSLLEMWGMKLGLERIEEVLTELGRPQLARPTVLVAGTNGKGSTTSLLHSILKAAGYRSGLYTSPHLESVEERLRIDGRAVDSVRFAEALRAVLEAAIRAGQDAPPTYFETVTAAAFLWFAQEKVDLSVLEVGLGGRLDATNTASPLLSAITSIGRDHTQQLGETLPEIAGEKAGVLREGRLAVVAPTNDEVRVTLESCARQRGARLLDVTRDCTATPERSRDRRQLWSISTPEGSYRLASSLLGRHQAPNLLVAVRLAECLRQEGFVGIDAAAIEAGVEACRWPGRMEWIELDSRAVLLDCAHNSLGVEALAEFVGELGSYDLLFGSFEGKDAERTLPRLADSAQSVTLTRPDAQRALDPAELAEASGVTSARVAEDPEEALDHALAGNAPLLLVAGSLYLVGGIRELLRKRFGRPKSAKSTATC